MLQRLVRQFLAILQAEMLEGSGAGARLRVESSEVPDPVVRDLPTAPQVQRLYPFQTPGYEKEARVGDLGAAAELKSVEVLAVGGNPAQGVVGDVLAQGQVEVLQAGQVPVESSVQGGV